jgi:hypothetical protein
VFNNVILGLDPGVQTTPPPLDSSFGWNDGEEILDSRLRGNDRVEILGFGFGWNDIGWSLTLTFLIFKRNGAPRIDEGGIC